MNLYDQYLQGDAQNVYEQIQALGSRSFEPANYPSVEAVLTETFKRVSNNLEIIYAELRSRNYGFTKQIEHDFQRPILKPSADVDGLLIKLDKLVKPVGYVPLSLKMFYKIAGSCNFAWDYHDNPEIPWEGADPLQISPLRDLVSELEDLGEEDKEFLELQVSADYLIKDNISGGPPYCVEITKERSIDGLFLDEDQDTTFINYLRVSINNCGFSRADACETIKDFVDYQERVRPKLILF